MFETYKRNLRFYEYLEKNGHVQDTESLPELKVNVQIGDMDMELEYKECEPYIINSWDITFAIFFDEYGRRFLLLDRNGSSNGPEVIPFESGIAGIENVTYKKKVGRLVISIVPESTN